MTYVNYLGSFDSLSELMQAIPDGGSEGDYALVDSTYFAWNTATEHWQVAPGLINDLGTFDDEDAVWMAYPEGGNEGDYVHIDGEIKVWNKWIRDWGDNVDPGTPAIKNHTIDGDLTVLHDLHVVGRIIGHDIEGDSVQWEQIVQSGTQIATITINGIPYDVYAPTSGGGSYSAGNGIDISSNTISLKKASASQLGGVKIGNGLRIDANGVLSTTSSGEGSSLIVHITEDGEGGYVSDTPFADILDAFNAGYSIFAEIPYLDNTLRLPLASTDGFNVMQFKITSHFSYEGGGEYTEGSITILSNDSVSVEIRNNSIVVSVPSLPLSGAGYSANCSFLVTSGTNIGHIFKWKSTSGEWEDITQAASGGSSTLVVHIGYGEDGYESDTHHADILAAYLAGKSIYAVAPTVYDGKIIMQLSSMTTGEETEDMPFAFKAFGTDYENGNNRGQIDWGELIIRSDDSVEYRWGATNFVISLAYLPDDGSLYSHDTLFIPTRDDEDGHLAGHLYQWHNSAWTDITPSGGNGKNDIVVPLVRSSQGVYSLDPDFEWRTEAPKIARGEYSNVYLRYPNSEGYPILVPASLKIGGVSGDSATLNIFGCILSFSSGSENYTNIDVYLNTATDATVTVTNGTVSGGSGGKTDLIIPIKRNSQQTGWVIDPSWDHYIDVETIKIANSEYSNVYIQYPDSSSAGVSHLIPARIHILAKTSSNAAIEVIAQLADYSSSTVDTITITMNSATASLSIAVVTNSTGGGSYTAGAGININNGVISTSALKCIPNTIEGVEYNFDKFIVVKDGTSVPSDLDNHTICFVLSYVAE